MAEFYQKVKQEIEKGISNVSIRSKEVLENIKIKKQVENLEEQMNGLLVELGQSVYAMFGANLLNQEEIGKKCELIAGLEQQLKEKKEELSQIHLQAGTALGKIYCNQCNAEIAEGAQYCGQCGQKAPENENPEE
jgi:hypothetical protein